MSIVTDATEENPLFIALGLIVLVTSLVSFGLVDMQVLNDHVAPYAGTIFVVSFVGIYFLSDREIGQLTDAETTALLVPVLAVIGLKFIPQFESIITDFDPYASLALFGLTLGGYYVLSTNMRLGTVALQLVLGSVIGLTALLQFGIVELDVMGETITELSIWVFVGALSISYFISEHEIGEMNQTEIGALIVGVGGYLAYNFIPEFQDFVNANNPASGIVITGVVIFAYYFIMRNGKLY